MSLAGHPGIWKTIQNIGRRYWWPKLKEFVSKYIGSCFSCKQAKSIHHKPFGPLQFLPILERPWSSISMDFIERLPLLVSHNIILVIVCRLTKMALFILMYKTATSIDLARPFLWNVFSKHRVPQDIISDQGKHFVSNFWSSLCDHLRIKSNLSTAYHPETDRWFEWVNQILEQYLQFYVNYEQDNWTSLLPLAKFAYNNTSHSATGVSPFFANKGYHPQFKVLVSLVSFYDAESMATLFSDLHTHLWKQIGVAIKQNASATEFQCLLIPPFAPGELV